MADENNQANARSRPTSPPSRGACRGCSPRRHAAEAAQAAEPAALPSRLRRKRARRSASRGRRDRGRVAVAAAAAAVTIAAAAIAAGATSAARGRGGDDDGGEELVEKLVHINRVSKTVKGGKRFGFAALVVVGDGKGRAGFGHGKAREVPEAISKATAAAKKAMVRVPLREGRTLHHDGMGHFGAGRVYVRSAPAGTGIIAGGPMRAVFESLGVADVVTKSVGTSNPYNMVRATFEALGEQTSPKVGGAAPRQEDRRPDGPPRRPRRRRGRGGSRGGDGVISMATIKITQTGSPIRRQPHQRKTLIGLGLNKMHRTVRARGHPRGARHDPQGAAYGDGGGVSPRPSSRRKRGSGRRAVTATTGSSAFAADDDWSGSACHARQKRKRVQRHETERHPRQ